MFMRSSLFQNFTGIKYYSFKFFANFVHNSIIILKLILIYFLLERLNIY